MIKARTAEGTIVTLSDLSCMGCDHAGAGERALARIKAIIEEIETPKSHRYIMRTREGGLTAMILSAISTWPNEQFTTSELCSSSGIPQASAASTLMRLRKTGKVRLVSRGIGSTPSIWSKV